MPEVPITSEAEWRELRARHVGGSEVAALYGCSPYLSHWALWQIKAGRLDHEIEQNERMFWGSWLQNRIITAAVVRGVIRAATLYHDDVADRPVAYWQHPTLPGMGATPDAVGIDAEGRRVLIEVKCVDWLIWRDQWAGSDPPEPPLHISLQGQHTLACDDRATDGVLYLVLVGGNELQTHFEPRRPGLIRDIETRVADFWRTVEAGNPPPVDGHDATTAGLRDIFPSDNGIEEPLDLTGRAEDVCAAYLAARAEAKAAELAASDAGNHLREMLGEARRARCEGYSVSWASASNGTRRLTVRKR